jgi:hypothetical protein
MATVAMTESWVLEEDMVAEELRLTVRGDNADYEARNGECVVCLPPSVIAAIRGLSARQVPHLRKARKEVFSERSRKGWVTRRSEREDRLVLESATDTTCTIMDENPDVDLSVLDLQSVVGTAVVGPNTGQVFA